MKMSYEDEIALGESIVDWKKKRDGIVTDRDCLLCTLAKRRRKALDAVDGYCNYCIIKKHTGKTQCYGTPFHDAKGESNYHQLEIDFLESLRPEKNVATEYIAKIDDEVTVRDKSWAVQIYKGKRETVLPLAEKVKYVVVMHLKKSEIDSTERRNDTLLYNSLSGRYLLAYSKRLDKVLKLKTPKYCTECGKEK